MSKDTKEIIKLPFNIRLIEEYQSFSKKGDTDISSFGKNLPKELLDGFTKMVLLEERDPDENAEELKKELELTGKRLKILSIEEKSGQLQSLMGELEKRGEEEKLLEVEKEFGKLTKMRSAYEKEE